MPLFNNPMGQPMAQSQMTPPTAPTPPQPFVPPPQGQSTPDNVAGQSDVRKMIDYFMQTEYGQKLQAHIASKDLYGDAVVEEQPEGVPYVPIIPPKAA